MKTIALIATTGNREFSNTLNSIKNQTKKVDAIYIAAENSIESDEKVFINPFSDSLANNTMQALVKIYIEHGEDVMIATIDDDDTWEESYIEKASMYYEQYNFIYTDLKIYEDGVFIADEKTFFDPSKKDLFLYNNTGVQGSNKIVSLKLLLESGGMYRNLISSTDRSLNTNLLNHAEVSVKHVAEPLCNHNRDKIRNRLTTSPEKSEHLKLFYKTYWNYIDETRIDEINELHNARHNLKKVIDWK